MADPVGILEKLGAGGASKDEGDEDGSDLAPKAQALKDMFEAKDRGDWEAAALAYERAYKICKQKEKGGGDTESPKEDADEDYDEGD